MGIRTIILILLFALVVYLIRSRLRRRLARPTTGSSQGATSAGDLVPCEHCKTYIPRHAAIAKDGKLYCTSGHAEKAEK